MSKVTIQLEEIRKLGRQVLELYGATPEEAALVTEDYLEADLRGRFSHGLTFFKNAVQDFQRRGKYEIGAFEGSYLHIEGNSDIGHVVAREAIDLALPKLAERKIVSIGLSNISRFNTAGVIARYGAERGAVTLVFAYGGSSVVAPPGAKAAALNNTPIGIGIPHTDPLFVLDMATSERAWGHITVAKYNGEKIPQHWGVTEEGLPTEQPEQVKWLSPLGGYKGLGLGLALEIISGALVRVPVGSKGPGRDRGALLLLIDPTIFGHTAESFKEQVSGFLGELSEIPTVEGQPSISYPGQGSEQRYQEGLDSGVITLHQSAIDYMHEQLKQAGRSI
ncbi:Ldh family oxidoreductase [Paenibacillus sp. NPDC058071]|uniref:Ldh family oxidoreductase n=1 Tax=Paenibacillus sp. NPDC058071 TaxID=3346326 RepID=UPI0036D9759E